MPDISKLSINQISTDTRWGFREAVEGYARHGVPAICVWRHKLAECGVTEGAKMIADHGLAVEVEHEDEVDHHERVERLCLPHVSGLISAPRQGWARWKKPLVDRDRWIPSRR